MTWHMTDMALAIHSHFSCDANKQNRTYNEQHTHCTNATMVEMVQLHDEDINEVKVVEVREVMHQTTKPAINATVYRHSNQQH